MAVNQINLIDLNMATLNKIFNLDGRIAIITGGAGLLGKQHAIAIARAGGIPIIADLSLNLAQEAVNQLKDRWGATAFPFACDVTKENSVKAMSDSIIEKFGHIDILINNAAKNPMVEDNESKDFSRLETIPLDAWNADIAVGLTGAFLCSRVIGPEMVRAGQGVIINIASDLAVIAPNQGLYKDPTADTINQSVKPVTYSVVKTGLIGLTRYLSTYWAADGIRVNALSPGGVYNDQPDDFVVRLSDFIPLGRMAKIDEYQGALLFLCSDASTYMTGQNMIVDGGRTAW